MFDEPPEDYIGRKPIQWIGHIAGAFGLMFLAADVYLLWKMIPDPSVGKFLLLLFIAAIAAFLLTAGYQMTRDAPAGPTLMPLVVYRAMCVGFASVASTALFLAALRPDMLDLIHAGPIIAGMSWFAWMCYVAGWRIDD